MGETVRCFELRNGEGQVIFCFNLVEKEASLRDNPQGPQNHDQGGNGGNGGQGSTHSENNEPAMTEAQKRYLFRILAEHSIQGENAHQELKNAFRVKALTEVGKFEASKMIERLLAVGIGGLKNGSPVQ